MKVLRKGRTFDAWDTVIRELQAERDILAAQRDNIGAMLDYKRHTRLQALISLLQLHYQSDEVKP